MQELVTTQMYSLSSDSNFIINFLFFFYFHLNFVYFLFKCILFLTLIFFSDVVARFRKLEIAYTLLLSTKSAMTIFHLFDIKLFVEPLYCRLLP